MNTTTSQESPPEYADFLQREDESPKQHMAFLLWASEPSYRGTARLVGAAESTMRRWHKRFEWQRRASTPAAPVIASRLLRKHYQAREDMRGERPIEPPPATMDEVSHRREMYLRSLQMDVRIVDDMLRVFVDQIGDIRVRPADVPKLIQVSRDLQRELMEWEVAGGNDKQATVEESFRVKQARRNGTSITVAMLEDVEELSVILRAMKNAERRDAETSPGSGRGINSL
ncbi:MAG: hypothetical protein HN348_16460 [Proteobacteria bacterium]|jgi:hypothetical protein|nr:hypothetical protein [Pseudomonadota bacterium]